LPSFGGPARTDVPSGQQVRDDPLQLGQVELEEVGGVDRARGDLGVRPRAACRSRRARRRAEALDELRRDAVEVLAELGVRLRDVEPRRDLRPDEVPQLVEPSPALYRLAT
jgi:hypothetical protein